LLWEKANYMNGDHFALRHATPDDAPLIAEHRVRMFQDTGRLDAAAAATMLELLTPMLHSMLTSGDYVGWLASVAGAAVVAGAGVHVRQLLPRPETLTQREALVVNVYVQPEYRRRGIARHLMLAILEWCGGQGIERVALHASDMGRPLYESLGFAPSTELIFYVK
jgi:GNAT superfamily N-acetyltransferase